MQPFFAPFGWLEKKEKKRMSIGNQSVLRITPLGMGRKAHGKIPLP